ncbi:MAG: hypothetical protein LC633_04145 [Desulfobulbaceae bacterium]|nr:hypothetical protein [Desulfobulbaceae bacterium]
MDQADCKKAHLADELLIVRDSGEIPEVALHGSIFFLSRDPDGPGLELARGELGLLKEAAAARYREMVRRDLDPHNRDKSHYRGVVRCIANWRRMQRFCRRERIATDAFRKEVAAALIFLLKKELAEIAAGQGCSSINCSAAELDLFSRELGLDPGRLPDGWRQICRRAAREKTA